MPNNILFIFEGGRAEEQIVSNLQKFFVNENTLVKCIYGAEIYQMYKEILADEDLDTFNLLKERSQENKEILKEFNRNDFAEIYMFFDYDGHSSLADDVKLLTLLEFFNEETNKGKLYVSYPMVEALKHIIDFESFQDLTVNCKTQIFYKNLVHETCLQTLRQINKYDAETWRKIIIAHLKKMNFVINNSFSLPNEIAPQNFVFTKQIENYITPHSTVAVLSAFPIFLHDYYGNQGIKERIQ